jgi:alcohol dehydrogenase (NADP+)
MRVHAYAAPAAGQPLAPTTIERRDVGPKDVLIEIQYAGICHSDIHTANGDWGPQPLPVVPGHEIVGLVAEVGAPVATLRYCRHLRTGPRSFRLGRCVLYRRDDRRAWIDAQRGEVGAAALDRTCCVGQY